MNDSRIEVENAISALCTLIQKQSELSSNSYSIVERLPELIQATADLVKSIK